KAVSKGLQLAIFNSCDGLGLASQLGDLHIPQIIVMREPVQDLVAQEFLKNFLQKFSSGESLYLAVRESREKLHGIEDKYPCAVCLPIIC
ncbi:MAG: CHAT domain-containing protein, partial [Nostoc sp.]